MEPQHVLTGPAWVAVLVAVIVATPPTLRQVVALLREYRKLRVQVKTVEVQNGTGPSTTRPTSTSRGEHV